MLRLCSAVKLQNHFVDQYVGGGGQMSPPLGHKQGPAPLGPVHVQSKKVYKTWQTFSSLNNSYSVTLSRVFL